MGRRLQANRTQTRRRADKSVNDQGEIFDDFLSETPPPVEFEEGEDEGPDAPNGPGADRVKDARRTRARRAQQRARARRANETGIKGEDGEVAKADCREDLEREVATPKRTDPQVARKARVAQKHFQGARQWASRQGVKLTVASSKDLFDWAVQGYAHEAKLNANSTRRAVAYRVAQLKRANDDEIGLKGEGPAQSEDINFYDDGSVSTVEPDTTTYEDGSVSVIEDEEMAVEPRHSRRRTRRARRKQAGYESYSDHELISTYAELENDEMDGMDVSSEMAEIEAEADRRGVDLFDPNFDPNDAIEFFSKRRRSAYSPAVGDKVRIIGESNDGTVTKANSFGDRITVDFGGGKEEIVPASALNKVGSRRRANDTNLDVAAPNGRTDVEHPVRNTTDDYAQDSQYVEEEYADNASDDKANPDLTTDQNWAPGEGKKSSRRKATGAEAARYAEAMLAAGEITADQKWATMDQAEKMSRVIVRDRTALLERTNTRWAEKLASAQPPRTARKSRSVIPQNLGAPTQARESSVSASHDSDSLLFF